MRHTTRALGALTVLAVLTVAVAGGCGDGGGWGEDVTPSPAPLPSGAADITGIVKTVTAGGEGSPVSLLVVADPSITNSVDRAVVSVTSDTRIWAPAGEGRRTLSATDLAVGQRVAVRFSGPVAESYPVQATAGDVEVLSPPPGD